MFLRSSFPRQCVYRVPKLAIHHTGKLLVQSFFTELLGWRSSGMGATRTSNGSTGQGLVQRGRLLNTRVNHRRWRHSTRHHLNRPPTDNTTGTSNGIQHSWDGGKGQPNGHHYHDNGRRYGRRRWRAQALSTSTRHTNNVVTRLRRTRSPRRRNNNGRRRCGSKYKEQDFYPHRTVRQSNVPRAHY